MRVRIKTVMHGSIDGVDLTKFEVDRVYDMGTSLANYLMASGYAMPVVDEKPALVVPLDDVDTVSDARSPRVQAGQRPARHKS